MFAMDTRYTCNAMSLIQSTHWDNKEKPWLAPRDLGWLAARSLGWLPGILSRVCIYVYMYVYMYEWRLQRIMVKKMVSMPCSQAPWCGAPHSKVVYIPHFPILWSKYISPFYLQKVPNQLFHTTPSHRPPFYFFIKAWVPAQTRASQWVSLIYWIAINSGTKMVFYCSIIVILWLKL